MALIIALGARAMTLMVLAVVPLTSFAATVTLARADAWRRHLVFFEKAAIAAGATAGALAVAGEPLFPGLDLVVLGLGAFLAAGRIGCFRVGCCFGRRARAGVRYRWDHAAAGFPLRWVGVPLLPVQLVDGAASALATLVGAAIQLGAHAAGAPLAAYVCVYGSARFVLERVRGDEARAVRGGATEGQWSAALAAAACVAFVPLWWTRLVAASLGAGLIVLIAARLTRRWPSLWLTGARHAAEVDATVARLIAGGPTLTTSEGVALSLTSAGPGRFELVLSGLPFRAARALARQLGRDWTAVAVTPCAGGGRALLAWSQPGVSAGSRRGSAPAGSPR